MLKITLAYLAGALTIGATVYAAGGRATLVTFGIGFLLAALLLVAALSSPRRQRRAARLLNMLANALDHAGGETKRAKPAQMPAIEVSQVERDVAAALVNFGASKTQAGRLAREAAQSGEPFEKAFKRALSLRKVAA